MSEQCRHEHMCGGDKTGMSAHTPGPWYVDGLRKTRVATAEDLTIATAHAGADRSKNKAEANARLIAAAPALLEALEAILRDHSIDISVGNGSAARTAIAQAKGESA